MNNDRWYVSWRLEVAAWQAAFGLGDVEKPEAAWLLLIHQRIEQRGR